MVPRMAGANQVLRQSLVTWLAPAIGGASRFHQGYDRPTVTLGHGQERRHPHHCVRVAEEDNRLCTRGVTEATDLARRRRIADRVAAVREWIEVREDLGNGRHERWRYLGASTRRLDSCYHCRKRLALGNLLPRLQALSRRYR